MMYADSLVPLPVIMNLSLTEIADIIGAESRSVSSDAGAGYTIDSLLTDSRSFRTGAGTLFFALSTPSGDGHNYVADLYARGVRAFVVDHMPEGDFPRAIFLTVESPLKALQALGAHMRRASSAKVVAITGSRGKTIVKEWLNAALEPEPGVVRSPRSYNSRIGVPLSLARIAPDTSVAIIEAGISRAGEMQTLSQMIAPGVAVFTNLGDEHADGFPSLEGKGAEKALLASSAHTVVYPADSPVLARALAPYAEGRRFIAWSMTDPGAQLYVKSVEPAGHGDTPAHNVCVRGS